MKNEPYRLFFLIGIFYLVWGILIWLPQLWSEGNYPVVTHRYLMLNGFSASFIAGFLMTAVPKFSKTATANWTEVGFFFTFTVLGLLFAIIGFEKTVYAFSALQACLILFFLFKRIANRKENPPYSFLFIFVGLFLWLISALLEIFTDSYAFKNLHYEGAISAIILGVGSRLIPGILGHVEIVQSQRAHYETPASLLKTVPHHFFLMIFLFVTSYFLNDHWGIFLRAIIVAVTGLFYWKLHHLPKERTSLTWCLWTACWFIVLSFILKATWQEGMIHASHAFFISGIVLLNLLIATRVLQSHGPKDKRLENLKLLYLVTALIFLAAVTRVCAFLMPESYFIHLGISSLILASALFGPFAISVT